MVRIERDPLSALILQQASVFCKGVLGRICLLYTSAQRLKEAAEKAKIELSSAMSSQINLPFITADATGPKHLDMTLTRAKFNELTADLVDRTMTPVRKALQDAGCLLYTSRCV